MEECLSCGRSDRPLFPLPSSLNPSLKACIVCLQEYGEEVLAREADRLLAAGIPLDNKPRCLLCKSPVVVKPDGKVPLYCRSCLDSLWRELKSVYNMVPLSTPRS